MASYVYDSHCVLEDPVLCLTALRLTGNSESPVCNSLTMLCRLSRTLGCLCPCVKVLFFTRCCFCR